MHEKYLFVFILLISSYLFCVFFAAKGFLKKFEFALPWYPHLLYYWCVPLSTPFSRICFLTNLATIFSPRLLIYICVPLFLSVRVSSYLWESLLFYDHLWESFRHLLDFLKSLWKQASVWMLLSQMYLLSSKHNNDILLTSYVAILCFLLWILLILCLITFLQNKMNLYSLNSVLDSLPSTFFIECIFDFNPTNSSFIFPLDTSSFC